MIADSPIVYVVDSETALRDELDRLLWSADYVVHRFCSPETFLAMPRGPEPSCLLLDVQLPGRKSGLELQKVLLDQGDGIPVIFLTAYDKVPVSVAAMKAGAFDFLLRPFEEQALLDTINSAIIKDRALKAIAAKKAAFEALLGTLSQRERQVIAFVADGLANKEIAAKLGLKEITIKVHRSSAMRKLQCRSVVELVKKFKNRDA